MTRDTGRTLILAVLVALACSAWLVCLQEPGSGQRELAGRWLAACYPAYLVLSLAVALLVPTPALAWALALMSTDFVCSTLLIGTQLAPLEAGLNLLMALPCALSAHIGNRLRTHIQQ